MKTNLEKMIRAGLALQVAALEWSEDRTVIQSEARQAMDAMRKALNSAHEALASMNRASNDRRQGRIPNVGDC